MSSNTSPRPPESFWPALLLAVLAGAAVLLLRIPGENFAQNSLWAEDGKIFITQALSNGPASVFTPYNGYIHLYPRLVALLAVQLPLTLLPLVMLSGWMLTWLFMTTMMVSVGRAIGLSVVTCIFAVAAATAQPHSGETLFNLTNSHWFMAIALVLYLARPQPGNCLRWWHHLPLLLACLTGPFSLLLLPLLAIRLYLLRDWGSHKGMYITIVLCAAVQAGFLASSPRFASYGLFNIGLHDWFSTFYNALTFGRPRRYVVVAAGLLWLLFATLAVAAWKKDRTIFVVVLLLFIASATELLASFASNANNPVFMTPLGSSARYYVLPYALLFFAVLVLGKGKRGATALGMLLIVVICRGGFMRLPDYQPLEWNAFARLAAMKPGTIIPINPAWPEYPGWFVRLPATSPGRLSDQPLGFLEKTGDGPAVYTFHRKQQCAGSLYLALFADIDQENPGWLRLQWSGKSMRRFYPAGASRAEFALASRNPDEAWTLTFDQGSGALALHSLRLACLDTPSPGQ